MFMKSNLIKQIAVAFLLLTNYTAMAQSNIQWSVVLERENRPSVVAATFESSPVEISKTIDGIKVNTVVNLVNGQLVFKATASCDKENSCYLSLRANY